MKTKGFTLLEIIVVVGIIGALVSVGTFSYSTVQKKARDSKRKTDLVEIQNALEQYYSVCGFVYPTPGVNNIVPTVVCTTPPVDIMKRTPKDPLTGADYTMQPAVGVAGTYAICAPTIAPNYMLETEQSPDNWYCLQNKQ